MSDRSQPSRAYASVMIESNRLRVFISWSGPLAKEVAIAAGESFWLVIYDGIRVVPGLKKHC